MSPDTGPLSVATPVHEFPAHSAQRLCASFEFSPPIINNDLRLLVEGLREGDSRPVDVNHCPMCLPAVINARWFSQAEKPEAEACCS